MASLGALQLDTSGFVPVLKERLVNALEAAYNPPPVNETHETVLSKFLDRQPSFWILGDLKRCCAAGIPCTASVADEVPRLVNKVFMQPLLQAFLKCSHNNSVSPTAEVITCASIVSAVTAVRHVPGYVVEHVTAGIVSYVQVEREMVKAEFKRRLMIDEDARLPPKFVPSQDAPAHVKADLKKRYGKHVVALYLEKARGVQAQRRVAAFALAITLSTYLADVAHRAYAHNQKSWPQPWPRGSDLLSVNNYLTLSKAKYTDYPWLLNCFFAIKTKLKVHGNDVKLEMHLMDDAVARIAKFLEEN